MTRSRFSMLFVTLFAVLAVVFPAVAQAGSITSSSQSIALSYAVPESVTLSVTNATLNMTLAPLAAGNNATVTTQYNLVAGSHSTTNLVTLFYFSNSTALTGPSSVPSSNVVATLNAGTGAGLGTAQSNCGVAAGTLGGINWIPIIPAGSTVCGYSFNSVPFTTNANSSYVTNVGLAFTSGSAPSAAGSWSGTLNVIASVN